MHIRKLFFFIIFIHVIQSSIGQEMTAPSIYTVNFGTSGALYSLPILTLGESTSLRLSFDDLSNDAKYYRYKLQHCDQNWNPTAMEDFEYIEGLNDQLINDFYFSNQTHVNYVYYYVDFPNKNTRLKISGNYLITIYDEETDEVVLVRKFLVVDKKVFTSASFKRSPKVSELRTHQAIDFSINFKDFQLSNPLQDISVTILPNGIWAKAKSGIKPRNVFGEIVEFDWRAHSIFPGGKDFRYIDIRSLDYRSFGVADVTEYQDGFVVTKEVEETRKGRTYFLEKDQNGSFLIQNQNNFSQNPETSSEYAEVDFKFDPGNMGSGSKIYVAGGFTNYEMDPKYQLNYDRDSGLYKGTLLMKQGRYDYLYVVADEDGRQLDFDTLEGNSNETENYYLILTYYRPFGAIYDGLISADIISM